jgi:Protein of unknown function (DUF3365)
MRCVPHAISGCETRRLFRLSCRRIEAGRGFPPEAEVYRSPHWKDDKAFPLPAQFLRLAADLVAEKTESFSYALLSLWPVNKQNAPITEGEKKGLQYVVDHSDENYYGEEELGGTKYYTAVYPDKAVSEACITCHNKHKDSPRSDFKLNDVMGGVVIRIPLNEG